MFPDEIPKDETRALPEQDLEAKFEAFAEGASKLFREQQVLNQQISASINALNRAVSNLVQQLGQISILLQPCLPSPVQAEQGAPGAAPADDSTATPGSRSGG